MIDFSIADDVKALSFAFQFGYLDSSEIIDIADSWVLKTTDEIPVEVFDLSIPSQANTIEDTLKQLSVGSDKYLSLMKFVKLFGDRKHVDTLCGSLASVMGPGDPHPWDKIYALNEELQMLAGAIHAETGETLNFFESEQKKVYVKFRFLIDSFVI